MWNISQTLVGLFRSLPHSALLQFVYYSPTCYEWARANNGNSRPRMHLKICFVWLLKFIASFIRKKKLSLGFFGLVNFEVVQPPSSDHQMNSTAGALNRSELSDTQRFLVAAVVRSCRPSIFNLLIKKIKEKSESQCVGEINWIFHSTSSRVVFRWFFYRFSFPQLFSTS